MIETTLFAGVRAFTCLIEFARKLVRLVLIVIALAWLRFSPSFGLSLRPTPPRPETSRASVSPGDDREPQDSYLPDLVDDCVSICHPICKDQLDTFCRSLPCRQP